MLLLSLEELSKELSVSSSTIKNLIEKNIIIPFGGRARLGEPKFSISKLQEIRETLHNHFEAVRQ